MSYGPHDGNGHAKTSGPFGRSVLWNTAADAGAACLEQGEQERTREYARAFHECFYAASLLSGCLLLMRLLSFAPDVCCHCLLYAVC